MIATVKRNWKDIQKAMLQSKATVYNWKDYSQRISNGLSSASQIKSGCGSVLFFVENLPEYAKLSNEYLKFAKKMSEDEIEFIDRNRDFLIDIN